MLLLFLMNVVYTKKAFCPLHFYGLGMLYLTINVLGVIIDHAHRFLLLLSFGSSTIFFEIFLSKSVSLPPPSFSYHETWIVIKMVYFSIAYVGIYLSYPMKV